MKLSTKILALAMMWAAVGYTCYKISSSGPIFIKQANWIMPIWLPLVVLIGTVAGVTNYIRRVPLTPETETVQTQ
jgi:hypothetical protein